MCTSSCLGRSEEMFPSDMVTFFLWRSERKGSEKSRVQRRTRPHRGAADTRTVPKKSHHGRPG
jgi:hypothetical protein